MGIEYVPSELMDPYDGNKIYELSSFYYLQ